MKILDFLFFYLVSWYDWFDSKSKKFPSHKDQAAYVTTILLGTWIFTADIIIEHWMFRAFLSEINLFIFVIILVFVYLGLRNIYLTKGRYDRILRKSTPEFSISEKHGRIIVIGIFFASVITAGLVVLILHHIL